MASQSEKTAPTIPALIYNVHVAGSPIAGNTGYYYHYGLSYGPYPRPEIRVEFLHVTKPPSSSPSFQRDCLIM